MRPNGPDQDCCLTEVRQQPSKHSTCNADHTGLWNSHQGGSFWVMLARTWWIPPNWHFDPIATEAWHLRTRGWGKMFLFKFFSTAWTWNKDLQLSNHKSRGEIFITNLAGKTKLPNTLTLHGTTVRWHLQRSSNHDTSRSLQHCWHRYANAKFLTPPQASQRIMQFDL